MDRRARGPVQVGRQVGGAQATGLVGGASVRPGDQRGQRLALVVQSDQRMHRGAYADGHDRDVADRGDALGQGLDHCRADRMRVLDLPARLRRGQWVLAKRGVPPVRAEFEGHRLGRGGPDVQADDHLGRGAGARAPSLLVPGAHRPHPRAVRSSAWASTAATTSASAARSSPRKPRTAATDSSRVPVAERVHLGGARVLHRGAQARAGGRSRPRPPGRRPAARGPPPARRAASAGSGRGSSASRRRRSGPGRGGCCGFAKRSSSAAR